MRLIDFHNHILPGIDDGSKTMQESIEMLRHAQEQGITDVVNTVHYQHPKMEGKNTDYDYISSVKDELLEEMYKKNIKINIHLGAEVFFNFNLLDILNNPLITFCSGKYMLVEFQTFMMPKGYEKHLYDLKISGVTPIIAHPERYKAVQDDIEIIEKLINSGCLIQIDGGSLLGHFGEKCTLSAEIMLKRNMVHIIGSDSHNNKNRNFCLKAAVNVAREIINDYVYILVNDNPRKVLNGEKITPLEISKEIKKENVFSKLKKIFK